MHLFTFENYFFRRHIARQSCNMSFRQEEVQTKNHLPYMMLIGYVHYITIDELYYKDANGRMLAVCKQTQRFSKISDLS